MKNTIIYSILIVLLIAPMISAQLTQCTPGGQTTRMINSETCVLICQDDGNYKDIPSFCCKNGVEAISVDGSIKYECKNSLQGNSNDSFRLVVLIGACIAILLVAIIIWNLKKNKKVITQSK